MPDAAYWRAYRAAHRERLAEQTRARRQAKPRVRGDRHEEYARRHARESCARQADIEIPPSYTGHPVFVKAVRIVGPPCLYEREVWEDEMGVVVVALLERRGVRRATRALVALRAARVASGFHEYSLEAQEESWTERH